MCGDDFLERHETIGVADPEPSGQRVRDLHPRRVRARRGIADDDRQVERQIRHIGERVTRVDSERCEHREDPVAEPLRQLSLVVVVKLVPRRQLDSLLAKGWHDLVDENSLLLGHQVGDDVAHECKLLGRKPPIGGRSGDACCLLIPKARDAHLKELVEVAGEDGEESNLLEQRHLGVARELEDPGVEGEPTQLPVEDVGVVVIPAPDLGHHISAKDGRRGVTPGPQPTMLPRLRHRHRRDERVQRERRCRRTLARQPRPRPAAGTAHQDARRNLHRARRVRCQGW